MLVFIFLTQLAPSFGHLHQVFQLVEYKSKRLGQLPRNVPLYVRIPPEDLGPHIGLDDDAVVIDIAVYEEAVRNRTWC